MLAHKCDVIHPPAVILFLYGLYGHRVDLALNCPSFFAELFAGVRGRRHPDIDQENCGQRTWGTLRGCPGDRYGNFCGALSLVSRASFASSVRKCHEVAQLASWLVLMCAAAYKRRRVYVLYLSSTHCLDRCVPRFVRGGIPKASSLKQSPIVHVTHTNILHLTPLLIPPALYIGVHCPPLPSPLSNFSSVVFRLEPGTSRTIPWARGCRQPRRATLLSS